MTIATILSLKGREVLTLSAQATLNDALQMLAAKNIGALVISNSERALLGIISERDIVRALAKKGAAVLGEPIQNYMTTKIVSCSETTTITEAMSLMTRGKFRHMPVMNNAQLVGFISIGDIVKRRVEDIEREQEAMRHYIATA
jgi:CBS domain-containing protein